jgi:TonB family protein
MQINYQLRLIIVLLAAPLLAPSSVRPQDNPTPSTVQTVDDSTHSNNIAGLQHLLEELRTATRNGDEQKVAAFLKDTEIPNCDAWLHKMYDSDKADSWMGLCDANILGSREKSMQELFARFAKEDGEIAVRKVNDNPEAGHGLEWGWLQAIKQPLDIYFASWMPLDVPRDSRGEPIGYFMFIDGGFRWESGINVVRTRVTVGNFVPPKLIKRVDPTYPRSALSQHVSGTVRVSYAVGADGAVYNAHAISGDGLSDDPSLRKAAEDAVVQWRFQPATLDGKPIQGNGLTADVTFAP